MNALLPRTSVAAVALAAVAVALPFLVAAPASPTPSARAADEAAPERVAVHGRRLLGWTGVAAGPGWVVFEDGRVVGVGGDTRPRDGDRTMEAEVVTPGFLDASTRDGTGDAAEDPRPFGFALRTADGTDPFAPSVAAARDAGVLHRRVLPSERNPAGGSPCTVHGAAPGRVPAVTTEGTGCVLSLTDAATRRERHPESLAGLLRALESAFDAATGRAAPFAGGDPNLGWEDADRQALRALLAAPGARCHFHVRDRVEVRAALRMAAERKLSPVLVGPRCGAEEILAAARSASLAPDAVEVVAVLASDDPLLVLRAPGALAAAGVRVRFGTGAHDAPPSALRWTAALAVRHGMDRDAALRSLVLSGDGVPGGAVLLDGDPLEPSTRVTGVVAAGVVVPLEPFPVPAKGGKGKR